MNTLPETPAPVNTFDEFLIALGESDLAPVGHHKPFVPGTFCRYTSAGDKAENCAVIWHPEGFGYAKNWRSGTAFKWQSDTISQDRITELMAEFEEMDEAKHTEAASQAAKFWDEAAPAIEHAYLSRKQVEAHGIRQDTQGRLVVPLFDIDGNIQSLAYIYANGDKQNLKGAKKQGGFYPVVESEDGPLILAEGFATAASIAEAMPFPASVIACFDCGNLKPVALTMRKKYPSRAIIIAGDDDATVPGNPGKTKAREAAGAVNGEAIFPDAYCDFNDVAVNDGPFGLMVDLSNKLEEAASKQSSNSLLCQVSDLLTNPPAARWLVRGIIEDGALGMIYGPSGAGKSFVALSMACAISTGLEWFGHSVAAGPVVYMAGEGHAGLGRRLRAWELTNPEAGLQGAPLFVSRRIVPLGDSGAVDEIVSAIEQSGCGSPAVVFVDTLARAAVGLDENSARDMGLLIQTCDTIRQRYKCAVVLVHHSGHNQDRARGSSALRAALDTEISTTKDDNQIINLEATKTKESEGFRPLAFRLQSVDTLWVDEDGERVYSAALERTEKAETRPRLSPSLQSALASFHIARGESISCTLETWRGVFYQKSASESAEAKKKAFRRARQGLLDAGEIRQEDDMFFSNNVLDLLDDEND